MSFIIVVIFVYEFDLVLEVLVMKLFLFDGVGDKFMYELIKSIMCGEFGVWCLWFWVKMLYYDVLDKEFDLFVGWFVDYDCVFDVIVCGFDLIFDKLVLIVGLWFVISSGFGCVSCY